mmetsp:Transcript_57379/g.138718  ORF Transcript_57379/g.138718 Transcript_57379/m.138718 type:complete len:98 (-) Transcript_57379:37-330(-)
MAFTTGSPNPKLARRCCAPAMRGAASLFHRPALGGVMCLMPFCPPSPRHAPMGHVVRLCCFQYSKSGASAFYSLPDLCVALCAEVAGVHSCFQICKN